MRISLFVYSLLGYLSTTYGSDSAKGTLILQRMEALEARHRADVEKLTETFVSAENEVKVRNEELANKVALLTESAKSQDRKVERLEKIVQLHNFNVEGKPTPAKRALGYEGNNIAFTAYVDHDLDNVGLDQTIIFNQALLNDGGGYNVHTGVFSVPVDGVYHFDFFVGERNTNQIFVYLAVNSNDQLAAAAEAVQQYQDVQGGNAANLKLAKGDAVYVRHRNTGTHIEGGSDVRLSTFSGFLIYPVESGPVVGK